MYRMIAMLVLPALLAACSGDEQQIVVSSQQDGHWRIDASVQVRNGVIRVACLHSASGRCHYRLLGTDCAPALEGGCNAKLLDRFSLAVGTARTLDGPRDFRFCVSHRPAQAQADCSESLVHAGPRPG